MGSREPSIWGGYADARVYWLVECPGYLSARGGESDLVRTPKLGIARVYLSRAWRVDLQFEALARGGSAVPVTGARVLTVGGSELGISDADGHLYLELSYDPGRLQVELEGWRVQSWEGFDQGRLVDARPLHRVRLRRD